MKLLVVGDSGYKTKKANHFFFFLIPQGNLTSRANRRLSFFSPRGWNHVVTFILFFGGRGGKNFLLTVRKFYQYIQKGVQKMRRYQ